MCRFASIEAERRPRWQTTRRKSAVRTALVSRAMSATKSRQFAQRHGMTLEEVREMIDRIGNPREALEREAAKLRRN